MMERWASIAGYEGWYEVSDMGRVRSLDRIVPQTSRHGTPSFRRFPACVLVPGRGTNGYMVVNLHRSGISSPKSVHRLVANAFIENVGDKLEVNHINGDKTDNCVANLEWCSRSENERHSRATIARVDKGLCGSRNGMAKLTESIIPDIRKALADGLLLREVALRFGISVPTASRIKRNESWGHV